MCLLNSVNAEHISSRTVSSINCKSKIYVVSQERPGLIIPKDRFVFVADRIVFVDAYLVGGTALDCKAKS